MKEKLGTTKMECFFSSKLVNLFSEYLEHHSINQDVGSALFNGYERKIELARGCFLSLKLVFFSGIPRAHNSINQRCGVLC